MIFPYLEYQPKKGYYLALTEIGASKIIIPTKNQTFYPEINNQHISTWRINGWGIKKKVQVKKAVTFHRFCMN